MTDIEMQTSRAIAMNQEGRHEEALALLRRLLAEAEEAVAPTRSRLFIAILEWTMLAEHYAPARAALKELREDQIARLLAGDLYLGRDDPDGDPDARFGRISRFSLIVDINHTLHDARSTWSVFSALDKSQPRLAWQYAWSALPAVVEAGDFALAERYRGDPLASLEGVNDQARCAPLFPLPGQAPRLAAELMNLATAVRLGAAILRGLGRGAEAEALRASLLAGLATAELKEWTRRELDLPGTITREIVDRQMAQDCA